MHQSFFIWGAGHDGGLWNEQQHWEDEKRLIIHCLPAYKNYGHVKKMMSW